MEEKQGAQKKGFWKRWLEKLDEQMKAKAKSSCRCHKNGGGKKSSCC